MIFSDICNVSSAQANLQFVLYTSYTHVFSYLFTSALCGDLIQWCRLLAEHEIMLAIVKIMC